MLFDGIEVDVLSVGDADAIVVTQWTNAFGPFRVLIDGGSTSDAETVLAFLHSRGFTNLYAVVCTHPHIDHAGGLIEVAKDRSITISTAWMHDIRNHVSEDALRRASSGTSSQAEGVRQVVETTKELASAFNSRGITPQEPFAGLSICGVPSLTVLGPTLPFYNSVLREFTQAKVPTIPSPFWPAAAVLGGGKNTRSPFGLIPPPIASPLPYPLSGILKNSSVKENPTTQPFNNTSVILGGLFNGQTLLFTADAGADAIGRIPNQWEDLAWMQVPHHGSDGNLSQDLIERFRPKFANISACGDSSHPDRAIVSGLVKVGSQVFSTHLSGNLQFHIGNVPYRPDYEPAVPMRGTGSPLPFSGLGGLLLKGR